MPIQTAEFSNQKLAPAERPDLANEVVIQLPASVTLARGTVLGQKTSEAGSNKFRAYDKDNTDGTEVPKLLLSYDVVTDADGNIFMGGQAVSEHGNSSTTTVAYDRGTFRTSQLTGLDQEALDAGFGRLRSGTVADGILVLG